MFGDRPTSCGDVEIGRSHIGQPIIHSAGSGVDCRVGAVDGYVVLGQEEDDALVGVGQGDGFEAAEYEGVVGDYYRGGFGDGFAGDGDGEVVCEEDFAGNGLGGGGKIFLEEAYVVPGSVC